MNKNSDIYSDNVVQCGASRIKSGPSCFTVEELGAMAHAYNKTQPRSVDHITHISELTEDELFHALTQKLARVCHPYENTTVNALESCWINQRDMMRTLKNLNKDLFESVTKYALLPKGKKGKYDWLSTTDIEDVMRQYEQKYKPYFKFIDCVPSDHYKLHPREFPSKTILSHQTSAIVFNLDPSHKPGSHWVTVFFHNDIHGNLTVEYFDSTGSKPNRNIKDFLRHPFFRNATYIQNTKKHQRGNSECGVYSLWYILQRLKGRTMDEINQERVSDKEMNEFRSTLFRPFS